MSAEPVRELTFIEGYRLCLDIRRKLVQEASHTPWKIDGQPERGVDIICYLPEELSANGDPTYAGTGVACGNLTDGAFLDEADALLTLDAVNFYAELTDYFEGVLRRHEHCREGEEPRGYCPDLVSAAVTLGVKAP